MRNGEETEAHMELGRQYGLKRLATLGQEAAQRKADRAAAEEALSSYSYGQRTCSAQYGASPTFCRPRNPRVSKPC